MKSAQVYFSWIVCALLVHQSLGDEFVFPANEYAYSIQRDALRAAELKLQGIDYSLTEGEAIVDHYLNYMKWHEFERTRETGFPPSRPIEETLEDIIQSDLFKVLQGFPKGALLHTHENHQLSKRTVLDIVWESDDFRHLFILPENHTSDPWRIDFFINPPEGQGWIKVMDHPDIYDRDTLFKQYNLISILDEYSMQYPTDSEKRWDLMDTLWGRASSQIMANRPIKIRHLEELYIHSINEGVTYLETRKHLGSGDDLIYVLDESPEYESTYGKRYLETDGREDVLITLEVIKNITALYPEFIGHKRIAYTQRQQPFATLEADMNRTRMLHELFPDHVVGYDIVGHEDAGNSLLYYIAEFLKQYNAETGKSNLDFFFHTSETKWPEDLSASVNVISDPVGATQNVYEAILLGAKRVGHGTEYLKHPYLLKIVEERNIAVEVCPVSGMVLGYFPDIRSHPAMYHFRNGGKVVIGSDDAGSFGFDHFTIDWYDVFMSWGLDLNDLKQLALNSLQYSSMSEDEKTEAINNKWTPLWNGYIADTKETACNANLKGATPTFARILPRHGPVAGNNVVHVFGRNFERGICAEIKCFFGDVEAIQTQYITNQHIACMAPTSTPDLEMVVPDGLSQQVDFLKQLFNRARVTNMDVDAKLTNHASLSKAPSADVARLRATEVPVKVFFDGEEFETGETYTYREDLDVGPTADPGEPNAALRISQSKATIAWVTLLVMFMWN